MKTLDKILNIVFKSLLVLFAVLIFISFFIPILKAENENVYIFNLLSIETSSSSGIAGSNLFNSLLVTVVTFIGILLVFFKNKIVSLIGTSVAGACLALSGYLFSYYGSLFSSSNLTGVSTGGLILYFSASLMFFIIAVIQLLYNNFISEFLLKLSKVQNSETKVEALEKLVVLHDTNKISDEEFDQFKKDLLKWN